MDFAKFNSRTAASHARELHLRHPSTGHLLYNDEDEKEPCLVLVRGLESPEVQAAMAGIQRARLSEEPFSTRSTEEMQDAMVESAKHLVVGFKNMYRFVEGAERPMNTSDIEWFLRLQMISPTKNEKSFVEQVTAFASKRANFLGKD